MGRQPGALGFLCTTAAFGGAEMNVVRLAGWMRDRGWTVMLYGMRDAPMLQAADERGLPGMGLEIRRRRYDRRAASALRASLQQSQIRVLFANASADLPLAALALARKQPDTRLVYTQHMQLGVRRTDPLHRLEQRRIDAWIAPSPWLAQQAAEMTTVAPDRIRVIPLGIELGPFIDARPGKDEARRALDLPPGVPLAGMVGRLDRGKGQMHLIEAVAQLRAAGRTAHALIIGEATRGEDSGYDRLLLERARTLQVDDRIHFRPFQERIAAAYKAMDIFTLTSISETYGMVTIEAMASGLPVIATASAGTPWIVNDRSTGVLIPPADPDALARAIGLLFDDESLRARLAHAAREDAIRRFSHERQCELTEALIAELLPVTPH